MVVSRGRAWSGSVWKSHLPAEPNLCYHDVMTSSIRDNTKRRGRPVTTGKGQLIGVRLLPPVLDPLDAWIEAHPDPKPSRPEAIREALAEHLKAKGYLK